jgi:antitoxin component HigA of HigAB toxin-antitoxin module
MAANLTPAKIFCNREIALDAKKSWRHHYRMTPLQEIVRSRGIKQYWLAAQIGVENSRFTRILQGKANLPREKIRPLAMVLGVSMAAIERAVGNGAAK